MTVQLIVIVGWRQLATTTTLSFLFHQFWTAVHHGNRKTLGGNGLEKSTVFYRVPPHLISLISKTHKCRRKIQRGHFWGISTDYAYWSQVIGWVNTGLSRGKSFGGVVKWPGAENGGFLGWGYNISIRRHLDCTN